MVNRALIQYLHLALKPRDAVAVVMFAVREHVRAHCILHRACNKRYVMSSSSEH